MYRPITLTDANFDAELEKLCVFAGMNANQYDAFADQLPSDFHKQMNHNHEEWVCSSVVPNPGSSFKSALQRGQLAYQFANGFVILNYEDQL